MSNNGTNMTRLAELRAAKRLAELRAIREAKAPSYKTYVDKKKSQGKKPLSKNEWERKVLNTGKPGDELKDEKKPKDEKPKESKPLEMSREGYKALSTALEGFEKPGAWQHVISYAVAGKAMDPKHVKSVIDDISDDLDNWKDVSKANGWSAADKKNLTKAKSVLEGNLAKHQDKADEPKKEDKPKDKAPAKKEEKPKAESKDKKDEDKPKQKGGPKKEKSVADQKKDFLKNFKGDAKEKARIQKMSPKDFAAMLAAIGDEEEGGEGKKASQAPKFANSADMRRMLASN